MVLPTPYSKGVGAPQQCPRVNETWSGWEEYRVVTCRSSAFVAVGVLVYEGRKGEFSTDPVSKCFLMLPAFVITSHRNGIRHDQHRFHIIYLGSVRACVCTTWREVWEGYQQRLLHLIFFTKTKMAKGVWWRGVHGEACLWKGEEHRVAVPGWSFRHRRPYN